MIRRLLLAVAAYCVMSQPVLKSADAVDFALAQEGKDYHLGATGPNEFDCSGLTQTAYAQVGVRLPRTAKEQSEISFAERVTSNFRRGDLLFYATNELKPGEASHVGIYIADGRWISAQTPLPKPFGKVIITDVTNPWACRSKSPSLSATRPQNFPRKQTRTETC